MDPFPSSLLGFLPPLSAPPPPVDGAISGTWSGLLLYITVALAISFLCSVLEAILLSTSYAHIEMELEKGSRSARLMQKHKVDVERPIAAILTLNTIAHTVGAAGAGSEAVGIFGNEWFGVISAVLTLLILVFSEIIPKTIGATYWKQLNGFAAYAIQGMIWVLLPIVWVLEKTTQVLKSDEESAPTVSRLEIEAMARIGASEGSLQDREDRILRNLLRLNQVQVYDVMTPRTVVLALKESFTVREVMEKHPALPYSRIPVYDETMDDIGGFVLRHDLLVKFATGQGDTLIRQLKREIGAIPETNSILSAIEQFIQGQQHILLVIDEYGGTAGIVTMEDAIETLLGIEITDESDLVADLRKMAEQRYRSQHQLLQTLLQADPDDTPEPDSEEVPGKEDA
jgi:CBS domain containing-hemolysin-like protein